MIHFGSCLNSDLYLSINRLVNTVMRVSTTNSAQMSGNPNVKRQPAKMIQVLSARSSIPVQVRTFCFVEEWTMLMISTADVTVGCTATNGTDLIDYLYDNLDPPIDWED